MGLFAGSIDSKTRATIYGTLPDHGFDKVSLVMHTTETRGLPRYEGGDTAPHYSYSPRFRKFYQHADFDDGYVGTLRGHTTGGHGNCQAFQLEIICYSNKEIADLYDTGIWVGDFTDEQYEDLARFVAWARIEHGIDDDVYAAPDTGWLSGSTSWLRMTDSEWANFGGLTAHGAVPHNTHWDTGVLDLERISNEGTTEMWNAWVQGLVEGWAEEPGRTQTEFDRLVTEGKLDSSAYWMSLLADPSNPEWRGFVARTFLASW